MKRLTGYDREHTYQLSCFENGGCEHMATKKCHSCKHNLAVYERLAAYEDSGLTPEQVCELADEDIPAVIDKLVEYESIIPIGKLGEWLEAYEDDRLILLPALPDRCEMFLIYNKGTDDEPKVKIIALDFNNRWSIINGYLAGHLYRNGFNASFTPKDIGKKIFFTKEAAKEAVSEMKCFNE